MPTRRSQRSSATKAKEAITDNIIDRPSRPSRKAAETSSTATVSRGPSGTSTRGLSLKIKTSANKLREATRSSPLNQSVTVNSRESFTGGEIIEGKRARNVRKSYVLESDSDDEDEEMEDVNDEDAEGESAEDDGLGDEDADGDVDMDIPPPPPTIKISKAQSGKQTISAKPSSKPDNKTVEQKEVELGSEDEELSELDSDLEEEVEEEEGMQTGNEEDAEGEEEEIEVEAEAEEDDELDSVDETPGGGSRASTPDLNKLTKRQRARLEEGGSGHLLALPDGKFPRSKLISPANKITEVQVKKHLTAEEHAMRRAEMARRRKNLSEKRNEEEKARIPPLNLSALLLT
jgi:Ino eighty subunit 2